MTRERIRLLQGGGRGLGLRGIALLAVFALACEAPIGLPPLVVDRVDFDLAGPLALVEGDTVRLVAHPRLEDGTIFGSTAVEWAVEPAGVIELVATQSTYTKVVRGLAAGTARIDATADGKTGTLDVTVTAPDGAEAAPAAAARQRQD